MEVVHGDCREVMSDYDADVVVADPPYNIQMNQQHWDEKNWSSIDEIWDDFTWGQYETFTQQWVSAAIRALNGGSLWVFCSYHNAPFVNLAIRDLGGEIINEIIWFKRNAFPNVSGRQFTASHECILWAHFGDYTFNYEDTKKWPLSCDRLNDEGKQVRTVWDIPTNKVGFERQINHPTQKPLRVLERIICASTNEGDVVLDPFAGSGSTLVSAKLNNRDAIGIEKDAEYIEEIERFLEMADEKPELLKSELHYDTN